MPSYFTGFLVEVKYISLQTMPRPVTREFKKAQSEQTPAAAEHHKDAILLHSQRENDQYKTLRVKEVDEQLTPHEQDLEREQARKRKRPESSSNHGNKRIATDQKPSRNPKIHASLSSLDTYSSDDDNLKTHERTSSNGKSDNELVKLGGPHWYKQGLIYLKRYLEKQAIITKEVGKLSELRLDGQIVGQASNDLKKVVEWVKSGGNQTESMGLCVPLSAQDKPCTIFAVETATGDDVEKHENDILEKAAKSHNIQDSLTLVLYYKKGKEKPYKLSAGILTRTNIIYKIVGLGSEFVEFVDLVIRILATRKSPSWVVVKRESK
jgi:hypothetical protein